MLGLWLDVVVAVEASGEVLVDDGVFGGYCDEGVFAAATAMPAIDRASAAAIAVL